MDLQNFIKFFIFSNRFVNFAIFLPEGLAKQSLGFSSNLMIIMEGRQKIGKICDLLHALSIY